MAGYSADQVELFYTEVGRRIRDQRVRKKMTQAQLAGRASLARSSIANLEAGRQGIPLHLFVSIVAALEAEPADLMPAGISKTDSSLPADISQQLANEPQSRREFVEGIMSQLPPTQREE